MRSKSALRWAPVLVCGVLTAAGGVVVADLKDSVPDAPEWYLEGAADSISSIPYSIGPYLGRDETVSRAARELLRPNAILQRRYVDRTGGPGFSLVVTHCLLTRDMAGHYPPVCYPAHGWSEDPNDRVVLELAVEGREIPLTRYEISRDREDGLGRSRVFVFNFFVAPSREQTLFADQPALETLRHRDERLFEGVAQFQVLIDASVPEEERRAMLRRAIGAMWGAVRAVEGVTG